MSSKRHHHRYKNGYMNGSAANGDPSGPDTTEPQLPLRPNPENFLPIPRLKFYTAAAVVFIVSILCFCVSYDGDFVFDDSEAIIGNNDLLPDTPLSTIFKNDFWGNKLDSKTSHKSYRPLTVLTFRLSYYLGGGLYPPAFHIPNIILHGLVSALLLWVVSILFGGYVVSMETGEVEFKAPKSSLLCALLFAVHPIHTESVSGVVGRADLLCALLFLASFLLYVRSCAQDLHSTDNKLTISRPESFSIVHMFYSMVLCGLSVFCKEQGVTVIGICSAYDIIVVCKTDLLQLVGLRRKPNKPGTIHMNGNGNGKQQSGPPPWVLSVVKRHCWLIFTGILVLLFRWRIMGSAPPTFQVFDNPHSFVNGTLLRALNYNYLYSINAWLLVLPWWLCFDWSMGCVPVLESFADPRLLAVLILWLVLGAISWACLRKPITTDQRLFTMSLALIVVPFLPASNLFFRVGFVVAERILYLSSIGFCMMVVLGVRQICVTYQQYTKVVQFGLVVLLCVLAVRSAQRSTEWKNEHILFTSGAKVCPNNAKVHYNIGKVNADSGFEEEAIARYRHAISLNDRYDQAMNNLGNLLKDRGDVDEAEELLQRAVDVRPEFAAAWMNLGIVKASLKKMAEAEKCYFTAIKHRRKYPICYYNLGNLYLDAKMYDKAVQAWRNATNIDPKQGTSWANMAIVYDNLEQYDMSIQVAMEGLKHLPEEANLYFNMGNVYGKQSKFEDSERSFLKAIKLVPDSAKYYANLGVLYHRWKKYDKAEGAYSKALKLNPSEPNVRENIAMLHTAMRKNS